jgi:predicted RNA-binding protein with PUA-like domain
MVYLLLKTEPDVYSYADLERDQRTVWNGVANMQAVNFILTMRIGGQCALSTTLEMSVALLG